MISSSAVAAASHGNTRAVSARKRVGLARSVRVMAFLIVGQRTAGNADNRVSCGVDQFRPCRRLAAAANGPTTKLSSDSAHRIENGVPNDRGPAMAASDAATPKINTGME